MLQNINTSGIFILALLAAIVATLCDANHVLTQTLSYPAPIFFNQAWWVFPGFFLAFAFMAINYLYASHLLFNHITVQQSTSQGNYQNSVIDLSYFALAYLMSGFGNFHPTLLCVIFYGIFILRLIFDYERTWLLLLAVLLAIGGMFFEGLLAEFDLVQYRQTDVFNVPYWLGGVSLRSGMRALVYRS